MAKSSKSSSSSSKKLATSSTVATQAGSSGDTENYVRLRLLIDSFGTLALKYFRAAKDSRTRAQRLKEIEKLVNSMKNLAMSDFRAIGDTGCPPGMKDCGGVCIPVDDDCPLWMS